MCLGQGHNVVMMVRLEPPAAWSTVKHSTTALPDFLAILTLLMLDILFISRQYRILKKVPPQCAK